MSTGSVSGLWRYPVKSMLGEDLHTAVVTPRGVVGDRAWAVVDRTDGKVASAKNPAKWRRLLEIRARFTEEPVADQPAPPVELTFPDGSTSQSNEDGTEALSAFLGREVALVASPPENGRFEEVWPADIEGLAPDDFVSATAVGTNAEGEAVSDITLAMAAPPGTFFDLSPLHLMTTATLDALRAAAPDADFDVRRYRPNVLVALDEHGFAENAWVGREVRLGACAARIDLATMRCVMTTLAHGEVDADRTTLGTIARENRVEIPGLGTWACAGVYATPTAFGTLGTGDAAEVV